MTLLPGWVLVCAGLALEGASSQAGGTRMGRAAALWGLGLLALGEPLGWSGLVLVAWLTLLMAARNSET